MNKLTESWALKGLYNNLGKEFCSKLNHALLKYSD